MKRIALICVALVAVCSVYGQDMKDKPVKSVGEIDLTKFMGTWYEISRLPNKLDKNLTGVMVNYARKGDDHIREIFIGYKGSLIGKQLRIRSIIHYLGNGFIKGPLGGKYAIIDIDKDYTYFVMATPNRKNLWIMARKPEMDNTTYNAILANALSKGFESTKVQMVKQK